MAKRSFNKNYLAAGGFLIGALLLAVWMSVLLSDLRESLEPAEEYDVVFSLEDGAAGLDRGSPVTLGGQRIGRVLGVRAGYETLEDGTQIIVSQIATMAIDPEITFYENAKVVIVLPMFGSTSSINIYDVGRPTVVDSQTGEVRQVAAVAPGGDIPGGLAPGFLIQAGFRPDDIQTIRSTIENVQTVTADARKISQDLTPLISGEGNRIETILTNVDETSALIRGQAEEAMAQVDAIFAEARAVVERLSPAVERAETVMADIQASAAESKAAMTEINRVISEQAPRIERILANVEDTTQRVRLESVDQLNELLATGSLAAKRYEQLGSDVQGLLAQNRPEIERIVSNARITSDTMKLTVEEIRAQPWRLLQRPKTKELEQQLLYDAARAYAVAASDLRAASESLEVSLARDDQRISAEQLQALRTDLQSRFESYREAEDALLDLITGSDR